MQHNINKKYVSPIEAQEIFGISEATLANWRCSKKGPNFYKIGGLVKYNIEEFEQWILEHQISNYS